MPTINETLEAWGFHLSDFYGPMPLDPDCSSACHHPKGFSLEGLATLDPDEIEDDCELFDMRFPSALLQTATSLNVLTEYPGKFQQFMLYLRVSHINDANGMIQPNVPGANLSEAAELVARTVVLANRELSEQLITGWAEQNSSFKTNPLRADEEMCYVNVTALSGVLFPDFMLRTLYGDLNHPGAYIVPSRLIHSLSLETGEARPYERGDHWDADNLHLSGYFNLRGCVPVDGDNPAVQENLNTFLELMTFEEAIIAARTV